MRDYVASRRAEAAATGGSSQGVGEVRVGQCHFLKALQGLRPSVSEEELARYETLRMEYESR